MKKVFSFFLFSKKADGCSALQKSLMWLWNAFFIALPAGCVGYAVLYFAYGNYDSALYEGYFLNSLIVVLNIVPVIFLMLLLYFLIGRAWIAFLISSSVVFLMSCGNYFKLLFRDDPFVFSDLKNISMALRFTGGEGHEIVLTKKMWILIGLIIAATVFLALFVRGHIKFRYRICFVIALILAMLPLSRVYLSDSKYNIDAKNENIVNVYSSTESYISRGFIYPFIHSIPEAFPEKPDGYSEKTAENILSEYTAESIPDDKKVNIIGIQLEAFSDLERLGVEGITPQTYEAFHALEEESYTGNLVTNIFAGGTVDTERCFLTGNTTLEDYRAPTGSYVWYFKNQGYYTEGAHPCYNWFYNRKNINECLGFDNYYFVENRYTDRTNGLVALDDIFMDDIYNLYKSRDTSVPYFNFSVSYQGHGPYLDNQLENWGELHFTGEYENESTYYIMNNYLGSLCDTGNRLYDLANKLRYDEAPVVLVAFGDHMPWLGNGSSVYHELGINIDLKSDEGFYNYYSTRYLIWANDAAKETLGVEVEGEGPTVSPAFLMNVLFDKLGLGKGSEYMQIASETMEKVSVINTSGVYVENGNVTTELSEEANNLVNRFLTVQFFRNHKNEW